MKKIATISVLLLGLLVVAVAPSEAWHGYPHYRSHVYIGVGPVYGPYPYWYDPYYPYYPRYVYAPPPVIIQQEPPVYVQRPAPAPPPPAPPAPPVAAAAYWHYCPSARAYYPDVASCPEPWVKVPPRP